MTQSSQQYELLRQRIKRTLSKVGHSIGFPLPPEAYHVTFNDPELEAGLFYTDGMGEHRVYINASKTINHHLGNVMMQFVPEVFENKLKAITKEKNIPIKFLQDEDGVPFFYGGADTVKTWHHALNALEQSLPKQKSITSRS